MLFVFDEYQPRSYKKGAQRKPRQTRKSGVEGNGLNLGREFFNVQKLGNKNKIRRNFTYFLKFTEISMCAQPYFLKFNRNKHETA